MRYCLLPLCTLFLISALTELFLCPPAGAAEPATWIIRWHMDSPAEIERACREADKGFSTLLAQVRGRADAYYRCELAPRAEELCEEDPGFDPLATLLTDCKGHEIQAWLNVFYLWTGEKPPRDPDHPALPHQPWILEDNSGRKVSEYSELEQAQHWIEGVYADPADLHYRRLFTKVVEELVSRYPVRGIHLDFIRYPGASFGHGGRLAGQFRKDFGFDPRWLPATVSREDLRSWDNGEMAPGRRLLITGALLWAEMRAQAVSELMREVRRVLARSGKDLTLSAAVFPDALPAFLDKGQDWPGWLAEGLVDEIYPMTYFGGPVRIFRQTARVLALKGDHPVKIKAGLGAYFKDADEIGEEVTLLRPLPLDGLSLFSLGQMMAKPGKTAPYRKVLDQVAEGQRTAPDSPGEITLSPSYSLMARFKKTVHDPESETADPIIAKRLAEFRKACRQQIPQLLAGLQGEPQKLPNWIDLQGIFRFVHPLDDTEKKQDQRKLIEEARQALLAGQKMARVSRKYSQAGSKRYKSVLPRTYLSRFQDFDRELARLAPGAVSRIFEKENGYWFYKITATGGGEPRSFADIPWPARRILFADALTDRKK